MKLIILVLFTLAATYSSADENQFINGHWVSQQSQEMSGFVDVDIDKAAGRLTIVDCIFAKKDGISSCSEMEWKISENDEIFHGEKKVGDIFPFRVLIFNSHEQASEIIRLTKINEHTIEYIYSYSNIDGAIVFKKVQLNTITTQVIKK